MNIHVLNHLLQGTINVDTVQFYFFIECTFPYMPNSNIGCKTVHSEPCFACLVVDALLNIVCFNGNVRRLVHTPQSLDTLPWLCNLWYWII